MSETAELQCLNETRNYRPWALLAGAVTLIGAGTGAGLLIGANQDSNRLPAVKADLSAHELTLKADTAELNSDQTALKVLLDGVSVNCAHIVKSYLAGGFLASTKTGTAEDKVQATHLCPPEDNTIVHEARQDQQIITADQYAVGNQQELIFMDQQSIKAGPYPDRHNHIMEGGVLGGAAGALFAFLIVDGAARPRRII